MTATPHRLSIIITGLSVGGAETMLLKLLERLPDRFSPSVVSLTTPGEIGPRIAALGIPVMSLGMRPGPGLPAVMVRLVAVLRRQRPALVHTWMYHADLAGGVAARLAGVPAVAWGIHNSRLDAQTTSRSTRAVVRLCAAVSRVVPHRIVSCSEEAKRLHVARGYDARRMVVLPNGFDVSRFTPDPAARVALRQELGLAATTPLVGLVGRWHPMKNQVGFCRAAARVRERHPEARFVLAGAGLEPANAELARAAAAAGVASALHLLGGRDDMPRLMAALDVLASSSVSEAFPNVLGEAMACGVPCAVTDVGDSALIVGDTGRVVARGDMDGLGDRIADLLDLTPASRQELGRRARSRIAAHYEIGSVVERFASLYDDMLAAAARRGAAG